MLSKNARTYSHIVYILITIIIVGIISYIAWQRYTNKNITNQNSIVIAQSISEYYSENDNFTSNSFVEKVKTLFLEYGDSIREIIILDNAGNVLNAFSTMPDFSINNTDKHSYKWLYYYKTKEIPLVNEAQGNYFITIISNVVPFNVVALLLRWSLVLIAVLFVMTGFMIVFIPIRDSAAGARAAESLSSSSRDFYDEEELESIGESNDFLIEDEVAELSGNSYTGHIEDDELDISDPGSKLFASNDELPEELGAAQDITLDDMLSFDTELEDSEPEDTLTELNLDDNNAADDEFIFSDLGATAGSTDELNEIDSIREPAKEEQESIESKDLQREDSSLEVPTFDNLDDLSSFDLDEEASSSTDFLELEPNAASRSLPPGSSEESPSTQEASQILNEASLEDTSPINIDNSAPMHVEEEPLAESADSLEEDFLEFEEAGGEPAVAHTDELPIALSSSFENAINKNENLSLAKLKLGSHDDFFTIREYFGYNNIEYYELSEKNIAISFNNKDLDETIHSIQSLTANNRELSIKAGIANIGNRSNISIDDLIRETDYALRNSTDDKNIVGFDGEDI